MRTSFDVDFFLVVGEGLQVINMPISRSASTAHSYNLHLQVLHAKLDGGQKLQFGKFYSLSFLSSSSKV